MPPQYVTKRTASQMNEESKKATEEGMKAAAAAMEECFLTSDSEDDTVDSKSNKTTIHRLETRIHYMQLDMANTSSELIERTEELSSVKYELDIIKKIDNELALLGNLKFHLKDIESLTAQQIKKRLALFKEEQHEYEQLCMSNISKIAHVHVKAGLRIALLSVHKNNSKIEDEMIYLLNNKYCIQQVQISAVIAACIILLMAVIIWMSGA